MGKRGKGAKAPSKGRPEKTKKDKYKNEKLKRQKKKAQKASGQAPPQPPGAAAGSGKRGKGNTLQQMRQKLQGGQFRWLNEQLYTSGGDKAMEMMQKSPELFEKYHEGFREQTKAWPLKPADVAVKWLKGRPDSWNVADLGCGDAALAAAVPQTVHSFDLVATAPGVVACNMASLPLSNGSIDAAVFCLSLMGTDYGAFLEEAARALSDTGWLWIAEVQSRFVDAAGKSVLDPFIEAVGALGFKLRHRDTSNTHFLLLEFQGRKGRQRQGKQGLDWPPLRACQYKKR